MTCDLRFGDCLEIMRALPDRSVDLIATDPPYYKVKGDAWDRQWDTPAAFLGWFDLLAEQWQRILRPNGSLYTFAWPGIAAEIEVLIKRRFNVLQRITWAKPPFSTKAEMNSKADQRSYFPVSEAIIFAEHKGADNMAKGEAGYAAKCDELRGFVFEPLRAYLAGERDRAGFTGTMVDAAFRLKTGNPKSGMAGHWFGRVQWALPTAANYAWLRDLFGAGSLPHEHDFLRAQYEDLRRRRALYGRLDLPHGLHAQGQTPVREAAGDDGGHHPREQQAGRRGPRLLSRFRGHGQGRCQPWAQLHRHGGGRGLLRQGFRVVR